MSYDGCESGTLAKLEVDIGTWLNPCWSGWYGYNWGIELKIARFLSRGLFKFYLTPGGVYLCPRVVRSGRGELSKGG